MCPDQGTENSVNVSPERDAEWHVNICHPPHSQSNWIYVNRLILLDRRGNVEVFQGVKFIDPGSDEVVLRFNALKRALALREAFLNRLWVRVRSREKALAPFLAALHH
jgi:hypothetical protein